MENVQTTLHDQLVASFDKVEEAPAETTPAPTETPAEAATPPVETAEAKEARARDEAGRFAKEEKKAEAPAAVPPAPSPAAPAAKPRPSRPSSWKKDYWEDWEKIDPRVAEYIAQRESEYAKGVSTYKAEYEQARPLMDAMAPILPELQRYGMRPEQWLSNVSRAYEALFRGSPQEKLQMFAKLAQDSGVPLQALYDQQAAQQFVQQAAQQPQQQQRFPAQPGPQDVAKTVKDILAQEKAAMSIAEMARDTQKYPHYETVKQTMAQLLEAGLAEDLPSAYDAALRHPRHTEIYDAQREQQRAAGEAERQRKAVEDAKRAKANTVSPRSATPASGATAKPKGLRDQIADATETVLAARV